MIKFLTGLNDALYEVVVYLVILPKTLVKVIVAPKWICPYVEAEVQKDGAERFNEYAAPMIFFLGFCVMPILMGLRFTPVPQAHRLPQLLQSRGLETEVFAIFIFLISWPLAASLVIQLLKRAPLSRTALRLTLFPQVYCLGAAYLVGYLSLGPLLFFNMKLPPHWGPAPVIVACLYFYWFVYSEICIIRQQLAVGTAKAIGTLFLIYFVGIALMLVLQFVVLISLIPFSSKEKV